MPELSLVIPAWNEGENIKILLERLRSAARAVDPDHEVLVVVATESDTTTPVAKAQGARVIVQTTPGYGGALREGFAQARGRYVLTMDADCSHDPHFLLPMWAARERADVVIASRYVLHGHAEVEWTRAVLSKILNAFFRTLLSLPYLDLSSGFRLYSKRVLEEVRTEGRDFDVLEEILIRAHLAGFAVAEVPFHYRPRHSGVSHARLLKFGIAFLKTARRMWLLRNSRFVADYEARAFWSRNPFRRYWHRKRYRAVMSQVGQAPERVLDLGCGSSMRTLGIPQAVGTDREPAKLRYVRRLGVRGVQASAARLPFAKASFDMVIASHSLEREPEDGAVLREIARVLRQGGALVVATPDRDSVRWRLFQRVRPLLMPASPPLDGAARFGRADLERRLEESGFRVETVLYVGGAEMVVRAIKR